MSLVISPTPPLALGIVVAIALIVAETLAVYPLRHIAPEISLGVVYLLGMLVVSSVWGLALGVVTAVLSTAAFDFFHVAPVGSFVPADPPGRASLAIFFAVELLLCCVAALARARAIEADERRGEADERRGEADLAAEMARVLLRTDDLPSALPGVSARLAQALGLSAAAIELEAVAGDERRAAFPLRGGGTPLGTLLVPAELSRGTEVRVRERVVPSVEALLRAARDREAMGSALRASRDELRVLAEEQAALRRVATVVARGVAPEEVFATVIEEVGQLLPVDFANMCRYESEGTMTVVGSWGSAVEPFPVGSHWTLGGKNLSTIVFETGQAARMEGYVDASGPVGATAREAGFWSSVATPIIVEACRWGVVVAGSTLEQPMPASTEARLASFTELLATAIANAESRAALARLAEEQAALRRVATLVARGAAPEEVFAAVAKEAGRLFLVDVVNMNRYEYDGTYTIVASEGGRFPVGGRWALGGKNGTTLVFETGRPARIDSYAAASGQGGVGSHDRGIRSAVGTPIIVEGHLWGVLGVATTLEQPLPADTEARLASFTELVATAIANAQSRAELMASRARLVAAADESRRQIERDLHDGTQQELVSLTLELRAAEAKEPTDVGELRAQLARTARGLGGVLEELREISRGIHPAILSMDGLERALRVLARRSALPVELDLHAEGRLPKQVEVAAYYVVSEALTNATKHAHASVVNVELEADDAIVRLAIRDDGIGGADPRQGSGLVGISDRIQALGGTLQVTSPAGNGTTVLIAIPVEGQSNAGSSEP
ncbi:MAG TPA: GAF domain-containing protein [Solirubrobacteraceae bacterium]|nr:GAF domain-containing protein [Solirubrobacteraceae bacterium]